MPGVEVFVARHADCFRVSVDGAAAEDLDAAGLAAKAAAIEAEGGSRWVWADTRPIAAALLAAGVSIERCTDLRLCHRILRDASATATSALAQADDGPWDGAPEFDDERPATLLDALRPDTFTIDEVVAEAGRQRHAVSGTDDAARLNLLLLAESAGALVATEMRHVGLPWNAVEHDRLLTATLGPRPAAGQRPATMGRLAAEVCAALDAPALNPDSPAELVAALRRAGLEVKTTRKWELKGIDHPVVAPLLEYKQLSRLHTANGWAWLDAWVVGGRFHPDYVPGGVVTGRWATRGGGALQLPKSLRRAVMADPGWKLVVADAAQLEPRMLAAMSGDRAMAAACRGVDLYQGFVDRGVVATRQQAKIGMLAAMYGGVSGEAGQILPRIRRAFPAALEFVDDAAQRGERFEQVTTWLGRTSPKPGTRWLHAQGRAYADDADPTEQRTARAQARDWGRFTRNFVVQGTAAEWALCWMAALRRRLRRMDGNGARPELVYFLHDELIVHCPAGLSDHVAETFSEAADEARRLMFGDSPVDVPLTVDIVDDYSQAG